MLLVDGVRNVTLANGVVRVQVGQVAPDGQVQDGGDLIIPEGRFLHVLKSMADAWESFQRKGEGQDGEGEKGE